VAGTPIIDARAPRFNQGMIGTVGLLAFLLGFWPLLSLAALQLALTLIFGPRLCLAFDSPTWSASSFSRQPRWRTWLAIPGWAGSPLPCALFLSAKLT
jgi:hypothetical protein